MKISNTLIVLSFLGLAITAISNPIPVTDDNAINTLKENNKIGSFIGKLKNHRDPGQVKKRSYYDDDCDTEIDDDTEDDISESDSNDDDDDDGILNINRRSPGKIIMKIKRGLNYDDEYDTEIDDDSEDDDSGEDSDSENSDNENEKDNNKNVNINRRHKPGFFKKLGSAIKRGYEIIDDFPQM